MELGTWEEEWKINMNEKYYNVPELNICRQLFQRKYILTLLKRPNIENAVGGPSPMMVKADTLIMCPVKGTSLLIALGQLFSSNVSDILIPWSSYLKSVFKKFNKCLAFVIKIILLPQWNFKPNFTLSINLSM